MFVGLTKTGKQWMFTDGSTYDFDPRNRDFHGNEKCTMITDEGFEDVDCNSKMHYLCRAAPERGKYIYFLMATLQAHSLCAYVSSDYLH